MVQILREQTRNYAADQSGAIRQQQLAKNIGEWGDVIQSAGNLAIKAARQNISDRETREKLETKAREKQLELQQEADTNMINTQIGTKPQTELLKWNVAQIQAGVDPSSEKYTQLLYAKRDELYQPYIDQMTSEKGRNYLQAQGLQTAEKIRQSNIGKIAKNRQRAQARSAFFDTLGNVQNDAREFGKLGDWKGFEEATKEDLEAVKKYAKANPEQGMSEYDINIKNIENYALGLAESEPEEVIKIFGNKEDYQEIKKNEQQDRVKNIPSDVADKISGDIYEEKEIEKYSLEKKLELLPEDAVNKVRDAFVLQGKQAQKFLEQEMKQYPKNSSKYKTLEKKYNEIQNQIDDPEKYVVNILTNNISKAVVPIAKQQYENNRLLEKKVREDNVKEFYTMPLNPNSSISFPAQMAAALGQPEVEDLFQMSVSNEEMHKAYNDWAESKTSVSARQYATFEATQSVAEKMYDFLHNTSDDEMVMYKDGLELLTEMNKADLTQDQKQDLNNIMYGVFKDRGFADLAANVLEDNNKYFPDIPLIAYGNATSGSHSLASEENKGELGLPSADTMMTDIDSVKAFLDKESLRISKDCIGMLALAAQLPTAEERSAQVDKIAKYVADEKQKAYDTAMKTYGIDLGKLRENKRQFGQAFTTLGTMNPVEYMGDDPYSGQPLFRPLTDYQQIQNARQRILESANYVKAQLGKKEE